MVLYRTVLIQTIFCSVWLCLLPALSGSIVNGQVTVEEKQKSGGKVYRMKITPAAEPSPIFKHRFCVPPHDTIPANAATLYLRSFGEGLLNGPLDKAYEEFGDEEVKKWFSVEGVPIESLLKTPARKVSETFDDYINTHIERATRCRYCDWGLAEEDLKGMELYSFPHPSLRNTYSISRVLALQTRVAIAEQRFDRAAELIRMNYQLAGNVGKIKFIVAVLTGNNEVRIANSTVIDLIATPNSPNMYYALAELPRPIIDLREAWRLELNTIENFFSDALDAEQADLSVGTWRTKIKEIFNSLSFSNEAKGGNVVEDLKDIDSDPSMKQLSVSLAPTVLGVFAYSDAKQKLIDDGGDPQKVEAMPVAQVVAIGISKSIRSRANKNERWIYQPFAVANQGLGQEEEAMEIVRRKLGFSQPGEVVASILMPAGNSVLQFQMSVQRDIDALRVIEAIRMHVAQTGALPATLDEISVVPVPLNPATNKPFSYQLKAGTATLDLPRSDGINQAYRFELRL